MPHLLAAVESPSGSSTEDRAEQIQLIKDLQRAVDVLRAHANVDDERIAYLGISYGGAMGALFVGIERRLKTAVLVVGDGGLVSHFTGPEDFSFMAGLSCATRVAWFRAMAPIEPIRFVPHASPTAVAAAERTGRQPGTRGRCGGAACGRVGAEDDPLV